MFKSIFADTPILQMVDSFVLEKNMYCNAFCALFSCYELKYLWQVTNLEYVYAYSSQHCIIKREYT